MKRHSMNGSGSWRNIIFVLLKNLIRYCGTQGHGDNMRIDRFCVEPYLHSMKISNTEESMYCWKTGIYDRLNRRYVVVFDVDEELDEELAEATLTMLNIKYMGKKD